MDPDVLARLEASTDKQPGDGCWLWRGRVKKSWLMLSVKNKHLRARGLWWEAVHGEPPEVGAVLRAKCREQLCVNPAHMRYTPPPAEPKPRNVGDLAETDPATVEQRARCARLGVECPGTVGPAAALIVETELRRLGLWWPHDRL